MLDSLTLQRAVGQADVIEQVSFHSSMRYWHTGELGTQDWSKHADGDLEESVSFTHWSSLLIDGDCLADVTATGGLLLHLYGDLKTNLTVDGHSEIVIAGDCCETSVLELNGIVRVFVGGCFKGRIRSRGSLTCWINENCLGHISTGTPMTKLYVAGDLSATLSPTEKASLLYLVVHGFASMALLNTVADIGYTVFNASIGHSDASPGIYPHQDTVRRLEKRRSFVRWIVQQQSNTNGSV